MRSSTPTLSGSFRWCAQRFKVIPRCPFVGDVGLYVSPTSVMTESASAKERFEPLWPRGLQCYPRGFTPEIRAHDPPYRGNRRMLPSASRRTLFCGCAKPSALPYRFSHNSRRFMSCVSPSFYGQVIEKVLCRAAYSWHAVVPLGNVSSASGNGTKMRWA